MVAQLFTLGSSNDTISSNDISPNLLAERISEMLEKQKYLSELVRKHGEPHQISEKDHRYGWYPFGSKGGFVRAKTPDELKEKTWQLHKERELEKGFTFREALEKFIESKVDVSHNTQQKYRNNLNMFIGDLMDKPIAVTKALEIETAFKSTLIEKRPAYETVKNFRGDLYNVLDHAKKHYGQKMLFEPEVLKEDLIAKTNKNLLRKRKEAMLFDIAVDRYTTDEMVLVINECKKRDDIVAMAIILMFFTGLRIGEVTGLTKENIDPINHIIYVTQSASVDNITKEYLIGAPKKGKHRCVVYPDIAIDCIARTMELNQGDTPYFFPNTSAKPMAEWITSRMVDNRLRKICRKLNIQEKSCHDIRRTYESILDEAMMPSGLRHVLLGQDLEGIDEHYIRLDAYKPEDVQQYVNDAFKGYVEKSTPKPTPNENGADTRITETQ